MKIFMVSAFTAMCFLVYFKRQGREKLDDLLPAFPGMYSPDATTGILTRKDTFIYNHGKSYMAYLVQFPEGYKSDEKLPMVVYLHGRSGKLKNLDSLKNDGLPLAYTLRNKDRFIVLSPMLPNFLDTWVEKAEPVISLIAHIQKKYAVQKKRTYLTGHSLGGNGSLYLTDISKKLFAATVSLGAGYVDGFPIPTCRKPPVWVIHADNDENTTDEASLKITGELRKHNHGFKYSIIPGFRHTQLLDLYKADSLYAWMLNHHL